MPVPNRSSIVALAFLLASGALSSCGLLGEDSDRLRVTPNPDDYDVASHDTLFAIITNVRAPAFYYVCYPDIWLEQYRNGEMIGRWQVRGLEKCGSIGEIELGQSRSLPLPVPPQAGRHPRFGDFNYRLEARLYRERDGTDATDPVTAASNSFNMFDSNPID